MIKKDIFKGRIWYDYFNIPEITNINFHHGCTYYNKETGFDGDKQIIKIGCDYQHIWDEGKYYTSEILERDVKRAISDFVNQNPDTKVWCSYYGGWYKRSEGKFDEHGLFRSFEGKKKWEAQKDVVTTNP